jgi:hypothetical protein
MLTKLVQRHGGSALAEIGKGRREREPLRWERER